MPVRKLVLLASVLPYILAVTGVDVSTAVSQAAWKCLQSPGGQGPIKFAMARVYSMRASAAARDGSPEAHEHERSVAVVAMFGGR